MMWFVSGIVIGFIAGVAAMGWLVETFDELDDITEE